MPEKQEQYISLAPQISLKDIQVSYGAVVALQSVTGTFPSGSLTAIIGPNGSGKSTLVKVLSSFVRPQKGSFSIKCTSETPSRKKSHIAYLPQSSQVDRTFPITVEELVSTGLWVQTKGFDAITPGSRQRIADALHTVGMKGSENRSLDALSGGQFQRILFARLILQDAALILLDEPFTGIDEKTVKDLMALVLEWHKQGRTIIVVMHDLAMVRKHFPYTLLLSRKVVSWGETDTVLTEKDKAHIPVCFHEADSYV